MGSVNSKIFNFHVAQVVSSCNIHHHSSTCKKTRLGAVQCRLVRPQSSVAHTTCTEIKYDRTKGYEIVLPSSEIDANLQFNQTTHFPIIIN